MAKVGVSEKTFHTWKCALDPNNRWIKAEIIERIAVRVWCGLCTKHVDRLRGFCNFSEAFVNGIQESALKSDALAKHMSSAAHMRAESLESGPQPLQNILESTPIGNPRWTVCHAHTQTHRPVLVGTKLLINLSQLLNNVQID